MGDGMYGNRIPAALIRNSDTLVIGSGSYMIGLGAPGDHGSACVTSSPYECSISNVPSGIDAAHPTIITGDCSAPPELWGTQRIDSIFDLRKVHDVKLTCLVMTDHSNCIEFYKPTAKTGGVMACKRDAYPYGEWAANGIHAQDVVNLTLDHLDLHGFAGYGIIAGRLSGSTKVTYVTLRGNGWGGWSGDLGGNDHRSSDAGTLIFDHLQVLWNGCAEASAATTIVGCWGQNEGGYGDGFGEAWTGGNWTFTNSTFAHNTQDGLDLLYANGTGSVTMDHLTAWQNAGNGIKTSGPATLQNSVVNAYCNNWQGFPIQGDGSSGVSGSMCRAAGTPVVMKFNAPNQTVVVAFSTITGNGDTLFIGGGGDAGITPGATNVTHLVNSIWLGQTSVLPRNDGRPTALDWYSDRSYHGMVKYTNNIIWNVKHAFCPAGNICKDPLLTNETLGRFDPTPLPGSPALNAAVSVDDGGKPSARTGTRRNIGAVQR